MKTLWAFFLLLLTVLPERTAAQVAQVTSTLEVYHIETGHRRILYEEDAHFEAPNWSPDGQFLIINSQGKLYKIPVRTPDKILINTEFADKCNNDHGISPDGQQLIFSHYDQPGVSYEDHDFHTSRIYTVPIAGGMPVAVTPNTPSFWHACSPDGQTLAYTALRNDELDIYTISTQGGEETRLTSSPGLDDGPDFSPDGQYIYYNSMQSGRMEIWRMRADGSDPEQLTDDLYSNWFPHPSPDGQSLVFLSYLKDQGDQHPPMKEVALRLYNLSSGSVKELARFTGGQGTINVPSWSPNGKAFAFVSYK